MSAHNQPINTLGLRRILCGFDDRKQVPVYAVDLRKVAAEIEELRAALTGLVDIIESAGLLNLSNGVQLGQTSWYVKAVDRLAAAKAALSGIEGEDEQATRAEDGPTAPTDRL